MKLDTTFPAALVRGHRRSEELVSKSTATSTDLMTDLQRAVVCLDIPTVVLYHLDTYYGAAPSTAVPHYTTHFRVA